MAIRASARRETCASRTAGQKARRRRGPAFDRTSAARSRTSVAVRRDPQRGFSLLELMIVCAIITVVVGLSLASFSGRDQGGRLASDVARRVRERRASAIRVNALMEPTLLESFRQPAISISFSNLATTAPLVVEGTARTTFNAPQSSGATGTWSYSYQGNPLEIPTGWRIAGSPSELAPIPVIPLGTPTTTVNFTADGRLDPSSLPAATPNTNPNVESPFPAIYFTDGRTARAVAVHPSGLIEIWQYDEATGLWKGFANRTVTVPGT